MQFLCQRVPHSILHQLQRQVAYFAPRLTQKRPEKRVAASKVRKSTRTKLVQFCTKMNRDYFRTNSGPNLKPNGWSPANIAA